MEAREDAFFDICQINMIKQCIWYYVHLNPIIFYGNTEKMKNMDKNENTQIVWKVELNLMKYQQQKMEYMQSRLSGKLTFLGKCET